MSILKRFGDVSPDYLRNNAPRLISYGVYVYFIWINRDQRAFEWFTELVRDLKQQDSGGFFDIRLFVTEPPSGELPPLTQHGRPNWDAELRRIVDTHAQRDISVFFCGPAGLSKTLHKQCLSLGLLFKEEHF